MEPKLYDSKKMWYSCFDGDAIFFLKPRTHSLGNYNYDGHL
jgi:hypothetical protein